jgi:deazaflavin-dependent oxidoreductase (nitroreductase family)
VIKPPVVMTDIELAQLEYVHAHKRDYIKSEGAQGHIVDVRGIGGLQFTTHLLLETTGRRTGERRIVPLIYGNWGGEVVVVASKGGADVDPAWYLNLKHQPEVSLQIATQAFRASWREPHGLERASVWSFMDGLYPPYIDCRAATRREIPMVLFRISASIPVFQWTGDEASGRPGVQ